MNDDGKRLLLIEDDHDIRRLLRDLFTQEGYHVYEARDGPSGTSGGENVKSPQHEGAGSKKKP